MGSKVCMKDLGLDRGRATFSTVMGEQEDFRCPEFCGFSGSDKKKFYSLREIRHEIISCKGGTWNTQSMKLFLTQEGCLVNCWAC